MWDLPSFLKIDKKCPNFEKIALFVCIYGLNSHLKCILSISECLGEKARKSFATESFFCMLYMKCLSKYPYFNKPVLPRKIPGCAPATLILTFHSSFHANIKLFVILPIYRKLIPGNISFEFLKPKIFCLVLFWWGYKIVFAYKHLH